MATHVFSNVSSLFTYSLFSLGCLQKSPAVVMTAAVLVSLTKIQAPNFMVPSIVNYCVLLIIFDYSLDFIDDTNFGSMLFVFVETPKKEIEWRCIIKWGCNWFKIIGKTISLSTLSRISMMKL